MKNFRLLIHFTDIIYKIVLFLSSFFFCKQPRAFLTAMAHFVNILRFNLFENGPSGVCGRNALPRNKFSSKMKKTLGFFFHFSLSHISGKWYFHHVDRTKNDVKQPKKNEKTFMDQKRMY